MGIFANILAALGVGSANAGSQACHWLWFDEVECPESLIK
jgi:cyclic lactone autoinducer peptide